jgi:N-acetylglucosamine kinase-like BadF-type ATPase
MTYVLGVDGGNTKTIALIAGLDGAIVGARRGGCGDIYGSTGDNPGIPQVERAVRAVLAAAGVRPEDLAAGVFSLAGADWPEDFALLEAAMRGYGFGRQVVVVNDALGALRAGSTNGTGVAVVCGTGAAIGARAPSGRIWHGSFWLESLGALELGRRTLRAIYRAELGLDPPTALTARLLQFFDMPTVEAVLHSFTARGAAPPAEISQLARLLLDAAAEGDATARQIATTHGGMLGDYALAAARQVGIEQTPFTLVLAGGVLRHPSQLLDEALIARVWSAAPSARVVASRFEPAVGALFLALEAAGVAIDEPLLARLAPTLPYGTFFAT